MRVLSFTIRYLGIPIIILVTILPYNYFLNIYAKSLVFGFISPDLMAFVSAAISLALCLIICEQILPFEQFKENKQQKFTDIFYAVSTGVLFALIHPIISNLGVISVQLGYNLSIESWPKWIQFIFGLALLDFILYWWHRLLHESGSEFLWKIHEPHHAPNRFSFMAGGRAHLFDVMPVLIALALIRMIFGLHINLIMWLLICPVLTGAVHHTNVDFRHGIFNWIFPGPEMHRTHHDKDMEEALNYSTCFPFWDFVFRTTKPFRSAGETDYGLEYHNDEQESYKEAFIAPFKALVK